MRIVCERKDFLEGVQIVQNALTSSALPILSYILLEAEEGRINLTATNLETTIRSSFAAHIEEDLEGRLEKERKICLPGDKIFAILRELPPSKINLEIEETKVTIKCENSTFQLLGFSSEEFPEVPQIEEGKVFSLPQKEFRQMIQRTIFAASRDETRQNLRGAYFEMGKKEVRMVATDGRRLAFTRSSLAPLNILSIGVIIPLQALGQLLRVLGEEKEVKIGVSERQIFFQMDSILLISQLIEAEFPNYRNIIPAEFKLAILADKDDLLRSIRRVSLLADEKSRLLRFKLKKNTLLISANAPEAGYAYEELAVRREGEEEMEIGFSSAYLLDIFKDLGEGEVRLELTDSEKPGVIRPGKDKDYICLIMPIRLKEEEEEKEEGTEEMSEE